MRAFLILFALFAFNLPLTSAQTTITPTEIMRIGRGVAYSIDWRPDEKVLAVGTATGVWLYSDSYQLLAHFPDAGQQVAWSPDGERLLTWTNAGGGQIWRIDSDGKSGAVVLTIPHLVRGMWSPDGSMIAGKRQIGEDTAAVVWDAGNANVLFELVPEQSNYVTGVSIDLRLNVGGDVLTPDISGFAWSPDGRFLAITRFFKLEIRDAHSKFELVRELIAENGVVGSEVAWIGDRIFSSGDDLSELTPFMWDANTGELLFAPSPCFGNPCAFQYISQLLPSPDKTQLAVVWGGGNLQFGTPPDGVDILDAETGNLIDRDFKAGFKYVNWKGNMLTGLTQTGHFRTWDNEIPIFYLGQNAVEALAWSPDGQILASTTGYVQYPQPIFLWDVSQTANTIYEPQTFLVHEGLQRQLYWNPEVGLVSKASYTIYGGGGIYALDRSSIYRWSDPLNHIIQIPLANQLSYLSWNLDLTSAVKTEWTSNRIEVLQIEDGKLNTVQTLDLEQISGFGEAIEYIVWSPDSHKIVIIAFSYMGVDASIWDTDSGNLIATIEELSGSLIYWRPDSQVFLATDISGDEKSTLRLIDADNGDILATQTTPNWSDEAAWKPDGSLFAVNVATEFIQFRDGKMGELVAEAPIDGGYKLAWSPDGTRLALGGQDGVIRVWDVAEIGQ